MRAPRKEHELQAAQEHIALLLSAIDAAGDVILVYRVEPETGDLMLTYMNEAYTRQTGYTRDEAVGRTLEAFRLHMPDDPGMSHVRDAVLGGQPAQMEIVSYRKNGSSFWNQVTLHPIKSPDGTITHWISVERDVSEAVERESRLEDQQARLLMLTSAARRLFSALDPRALVLRLEDAVADLLGGTLTVYVMLPDGRGTPTRDLRAPAKPAAFGDALVERAARTRGHQSDQTGFRAAAGAGAAASARAPYVIEVHAGSGHTLRGSDLFVLDLLAEYFGVAVRNASLVAELEERRSAILELNQVKTDLIAMLAHDFKSPLTSIVGFTDLALELGDTNPDQREYLEAVKRLALRLADFASDTLAFSRLERNEIDLQLEPVDLSAMVREIAASLVDQRAISVDAPATAVVRGDAHRLHQVLYNVIENAIKYSPEDSPVSVTVKKSQDRIAVLVADRGIGIPRSEIAHIFGRFSRASNARKLQIGGTGFGLYLARQITELHGGAISVQSTEGKGSTFRVEIPVSSEAMRERPLSVAVLDSEREARSFAGHALREAGLRVHVAHAADELLSWLESNAVDRIVIDLDEVPLNEAQTASLQTARRRQGFTLIAVGAAQSDRFTDATHLSKPYLVQDLLSALGQA